MSLTQEDLFKIEQLIDEKMDQKLDEKLDEKLKYLPTKDEIYSKMDEVIGELKATREEIALLSPRVSDHEERLTDLEDIHPDNQHSST